jgi:hypothetical protein
VTTYPIDLKKLSQESENVDNFAAIVVYLQVQLAVYSRYYGYLGCFNNSWQDL